MLAFDVGTTFSGVSYAILEPNEVPKIHGVTRSVLDRLTAASETHVILTHPLAFRAKSMWRGILKYLLLCFMTEKVM